MFPTSTSRSQSKKKHSLLSPRSQKVEPEVATGARGRSETLPQEDGSRLVRVNTQLDIFG